MGHHTTLISFQPTYVSRHITMRGNIAAGTVGLLSELHSYHNILASRNRRTDVQSLVAMLTAAQRTNLKPTYLLSQRGKGGREVDGDVAR